MKVAKAKRDERGEGFKRSAVAVAQTRKETAAWQQDHLTAYHVALFLVTPDKQMRQQSRRLEENCKIQNSERPKGRFSLSGQIVILVIDKLHAAIIATLKNHHVFLTSEAGSLPFLKAQKLQFAGNETES